MAKRKSKLKEQMAFLYPLSLIKEKRLSKKDVKRIKNNISANMAIVRLGTSVLLYLFTLAMMLAMGIETGWNQVDKYGLESVAAQIVSMFGTLSTIIISIPSIFTKNNKVSAVLNRIAGYTLFVGIAGQMLLGIYADAAQGFTTQATSLSASIIFIALLMLIQPSFWFDALFLDISTTAAVMFITFYCSSLFGMKGVQYYLAIAIAYPLCCYLVVTLMFYAEGQHYKEVLENERLTNKAYYDSLTQCKNRHALTSYLKENTKRWEHKENVNLLIIMFDIDNFKLYNDQFSHLGGDYCLKSIAEAVRRAFPSPSLDFFRYGGEEFLLFFELNDPNDAPKYLEQTREAIKGLMLEAPKGAPKEMVTISVGGLLLKNIHGFSFEQELRLVDSYLYTAKANGKDISCFNGDLIGR